MKLELLKEYGINYSEGVARCLNDEKFYTQILMMFLDDDGYSGAKEAFMKKDYHTMFGCMHNLKGACGNVSMTDLYDASSKLVELLRNDGGTDEEIKVLFEDVTKAYNRAIEGIRKVVEN